MSQHLVLRDFAEFLVKVFGSWWARIGVLNGVISYSSRIVDFGPATQFVGPAFRFVGGVCLIGALFNVYRQQKRRVIDLEDQLRERGEMTTIYVDKLRGEILHNLDNINKDVAMLRDEAFSAINADALKSFPKNVRLCASAFYTDLRSLKELARGRDHRSSAMEQRKKLRERLGVKGQELLSHLRN